LANGQTFLRRTHRRAREIEAAKFRDPSGRCVHLLFMRHGPHEIMQALLRRAVCGRGLA
jgi:hypothetical protein